MGVVESTGVTSTRKDHGACTIRPFGKRFVISRLLPCGVLLHHNSPGMIVLIYFRHDANISISIKLYSSTALAWIKG